HRLPTMAALCPKRGEPEGVMTESGSETNRLSSLLPRARPGRDDLPCGEFDIRIARDGTWYHQGTPFTRHALVKLFSTVLRRDDNGDFLLATPVERGRIQVDD